MTLSVDISHTFKDFGIDVQFEAPDGVTALFGPSGAGKSTIVNVVAGLLSPERGRITIDKRVLLDTADGTELPVHKRRIGYVFQEGRLFPHLTVRGNLRFGLRFAGLDARRSDEDQIIELLDIRPLLDRRPARLSGGEKQRVAIGRALLSAPEFLLMDEPLAALDEPRRAEILPYLERLNSETNLPILYVSHSRDEVRRLATTVVAIERGRVLRTGAAETLLGEADRQRVRLVVAGTAFQFLPEFAVIVPKGAVTSAGQSFRAIVTNIEERDGSGALVSLSVEDQPLTLTVAEAQLSALGVVVGSSCDIAVPEAAMQRS